MSQPGRPNSISVRPVATFSMRVRATLSAIVSSAALLFGLVAGAVSPVAAARNWVSAFLNVLHLLDDESALGGVKVAIPGIE